MPCCIQSAGTQLTVGHSAHLEVVQCIPQANTDRRSARTSRSFVNANMGSSSSSSLQSAAQFAWQALGVLVCAHHKHSSDCPRALAASLASMLADDGVHCGTRGSARPSRCLSCRIARHVMHDWAPFAVMHLYAPITGTKMICRSEFSRNIYRGRDTSAPASTANKYEKRAQKSLCVSA